MEAKNITGYEGLYQIYPNSWIYSIKSNKFLKPNVSKDGYLYVVLCKGGKVKTHKIHRIVAVHFGENPNNYTYVDHLDRNRLNNDISNLRWCSSRQNHQNRTDQSKYGHNIRKTNSGKFQVQFKNSKDKVIFCKNFTTIDDATIARNLVQTNIIWYENNPNSYLRRN